MISANFRRSGSSTSDVFLAITLGSFDESAVEDIWVSDVIDVELVVVRSSHQMRAIGREGTFELIEDAVIFIQITEFRAEVIMDLDGADRMTIHVDVPDLESEVITRQNVTSIGRELDV